MIKYNGEIVKPGYFPDGTIHFNASCSGKSHHTIKWLFESNEELFTLICLTKHIKERSNKDIHLIMPYVPNARMDRIKNSDEVFTLKYFAEVINNLGFNEVVVLDPHSHVSEALIDRAVIVSASDLIAHVTSRIGAPLFFYPDEGAMKRYSEEVKAKYVFGIKKRDWKTGKILGLDIVGDADEIRGKDILIVDDICSRGGTFYHSAKKLKELGAGKIYLCVTHCENTILDGELLESGLIEKVFTTGSIFTASHPKIEVIQYEM